MVRPSTGQPNVLLDLPLNESSGTAYDYSGNGNNGTATGTTSEKSTYNGNYVRSFDGSGDYVSIPDFDLQNGITIIFWYKKTNTDANRRFFNKGNSGTSTGDDMTLFRDSSGRYDFRMGGQSTSYARFYGGTVVEDDTSTMIAIVINSISDVEIYQNGIPITLTDGSSGGPTSFVNTARPLLIGADEFYSSLYYIGEQANWKILTESLQQEQIQNIYKNTYRE